MMKEPMMPTPVPSLDSIFTERYDLTGTEVIRRLSGAFGVSDHEILEAVPQLKEPEGRMYKIRRPPSEISPAQPGDLIAMLEGTGTNPLAMFIAKTEEGIRTYSYREFWRDHFSKNELT